MTSYRGAIRHAVAAFGAVPLADVTRADGESLARKLTDAGRSQRTSSLTLFVVRAVFARALDDGLVNRNPAARVAAIGRAAKRRDALIGSDLAKLRAHLADNPEYALWLLTLLGLRRSELLGLRWTDVDLMAGTVTVDHAVVADATTAKRSAPTPTKTRRGIRTLPVPPDIVTALRALRDTQGAQYGFEQARSGYLAVDAAGVPLRPERYSDLWRALCRGAGVEPVTLHAARHSSVTAMRAVGVPDDMVARWHGHDEVVMRRTYSHPNALAFAGQKLADVLSGAAANRVTNV